MMNNLTSLAESILGQPCYVVLASDGDYAGIASPNCAGCTHRRLDIGFRPLLQSLGRWDGRRPTIFVNDTVIRENSTDEAQFQDVMIATAVHELAHVVDHGIDVSDVCEPSAKLTLSTMRRNSTITIEGTSEISKSQHGSSFVRLACHIHYRAMQLGFRCDMYQVFDGPYYGIPDVYTCYSALCNEPASLAYMNLFRIISDIKPRDRFTKLFEPIQKQEQ